MKKKTLLQSSGFVTLCASLVCIVIGLLVGFLVLLLLGGEKAYSDGFKQILLGGFYMMPSGIGKEIVTAVPLIMCGLSVAFAFKTGLFNIGAAGQYTVGAFGGLVFALLLHAPWWLCLIASTVFGAVWGAIPGIFKAYLNVNEVITAIMFNWIGLYGCNTIMYGRGTGPMYNAKQSKTFAVTGDSIIPSKLFGWDMSETFGYKSCTIAIFLAIIIAILLYVVINKTTFGYELKACGCNKNAARYAGINEKRSIILSMIIAGALAGFGAGLYYLQRGAVDSWRLDGAALGGLRRHLRRAACLVRPDCGDLLGHLHFAHLDRRRLHERVFVPARDCGHYLRHYHLPLRVLAAVQEPHCHALHGQAQKAGG